MRRWHRQRRRPRRNRASARHGQRRRRRAAKAARPKAAGGRCQTKGKAVGKRAVSRGRSASKRTDCPQGASAAGGKDAGEERAHGERVERCRSIGRQRALPRKPAGQAMHQSRRKRGRTVERMGGTRRGSPRRCWRHDLKTDRREGALTRSGSRRWSSCARRWRFATASCSDFTDTAMRGASQVGRAAGSGATNG